MRNEAKNYLSTRKCFVEIEGLDSELSYIETPLDDESENIKIMEKYSDYIRGNINELVPNQLKQEVFIKFHFHGMIYNEIQEELLIIRASALY